MLPSCCRRVSNYSKLWLFVNTLSVIKTSFYYQIKFGYRLLDALEFMNSKITTEGRLEPFRALEQLKCKQETLMK